MPANLTHTYRRAEAAYRLANTPADELKCLQDMLRELPKHKGTDKLQADLKRRIAKTKQLLQQTDTAVLSGSAFKLPKQGAGRVVMIGAPNSGKSQLLASLTSAKPTVADYPFTTQSPAPGMMYFEDCPIQLVDMPPVTADFMAPSTISLVRGADMVFWVVDLDHDQLIDDNQAIFARFSSGKTRLGTTTHLDESDVGVSYTRTTILLNKCDAPDAKGYVELFDEFLELPFERMQISAREGTGLDAIRKHTFEKLNLVRVYTKHPNEKEPDLSKPYIIRHGQTLTEVAEQLHQDIARRLRAAKVWGRGLHDATVVNPDYEPQDRDIVEFQT